MSNPLISVIIPIYNSEALLSKCIDSLLSQTYENLEIILVDDGSKDSSWNICREYEKKDDRVKAVHKENGGVSSARNLGLQYATGDYLGFLDSDDYVAPELYEDFVNLLNKYPDLDGIRYQYQCVFGDELRETSSSKNTGLITLENKSEAMRLILVDKEFPSVALFFFNRQKIRHTFNEKVNTAEDYLFMMHYIMHAEKVFITNNVYYYYVFNENSITRSALNLEKNLRYLKSQLLVCRVTDRYIEQYGLDELRDCQIKDIEAVITNNIDSLFPEITYEQYRLYISEIRKLRDFRFFNTEHDFDSILDPRLMTYLPKKLKGEGKAFIKTLLKK